MRFFSGVRGADKKKTSASALFKQRMAGGKAPKEKTPDQKYKELIQAKMEKMMEDAIMGIKKSRPRLPGTKQEDDGPPKELSKNAKAMLQVLAIKKAKKEQKQEKKQRLQERWKENARKREAYLAQAAKNAIDLEKRLNEEAAAMAAAAAAAAAQENNGW